jgi:CHASE2 domain-containing sensor protein
MTNFHLNIRKIQHICTFELAWGNGQRIEATSIYPERLSSVYHQWQRLYLSYYQSSWRGWVEGMGDLTPPPLDWHGRLVQAEAKLLSEFHSWLRGADLYDLRVTLAKGNFKDAAVGEKKTVSVFLACSGKELESLPWETWEMGSELPASATVRIARKPTQIHYPTGTGCNLSRRLRGKKARVLAILGDETGLNFQGDRAAISSLERAADVEFIGWQPGMESGKLKEQIRDAIADERGWDILLFAGHSNETAITGGELAIAPSNSLSLSEIKPQLLAAKERGLQFALFNSCNGLSLAHYAIDLGLSQVAVMREPIRNDVAQVFLLSFLQALAEHKDVHDCLLAASATLKQSKNLTYPSAYLIPSLFCHPGATLFRIPPKPGVWQHFQAILPSKQQAIALFSLAFLSLLLPVQDQLLEKRVLAQAIYRRLTQQIPSASVPPVLVVQIDGKSIQKAKIADPKPMDRTYLAKLVERLAEQRASVIGLDYLLDRPHGESDRILARAIAGAIRKSPPPIFVFAADFDDTGEVRTVLPEIARPNWSLQGHIYLLHWYIPLLPRQMTKEQKLPFSYLLALSRSLPPTNTSSQPIPSPDFNNRTDFLSDLKVYHQERGKDYKTVFSTSSRVQSLTLFSYHFKQMWLHPIVDFSLPPEQVYATIPAWQVLENKANFPIVKNINRQVVIVAARYSEAGIDFEGQDRSVLHDATSYWFSQNPKNYRRNTFTGGEVHAYLVHHHLTQRFIVPIPDFWLISLAALFGQGLFLLRAERKFSSQKQFFLLLLSIGTIGIYGIISLQLYISAAVLLPVVFPAATLGIYILPWMRKERSHHRQM